MKRLLLLLPLGLAACSGEKTATTLTAPSAAAASRDGQGNDDDRGRGDERFSSRVVVSPANMHGWAFYDDNTNGPCTIVSDCRMVFGPGHPPLGVGSAELAAQVATERNYLGLYSRYNGVPFRDITRLSYWTYRQTPPDPNPLAISLQFDVDYDLTRAAHPWQGRLVFEPYLTGATVPSGVWQGWNTLTGRGWWSSNAAAALAANPAAVPCTQATPCTWAEVLARYPNAGINPTTGGVLLKAGGGWTGFRGNTDALTIGVRGQTTTYDFEPSVARTPADCRNGGWRTMRRANGTPFTSEADCLSYVRHRGEQDDDDQGDHDEHGERGEH